MTRRVAFMLLAVAVLGFCLVSGVAEARPGGGHGFSGRSGGGGGGGGGGDLGLIIWLIRLCIEYPPIGIPVVVIVVIYITAKMRAGEETSWEVGTTTVVVPAQAKSLDLDALRARDPEFSRVLFEDFVYALYAEAQKARHDPEALERLAPYLSPAVREQLAERAPRGVPVQAAIVGALRVIDVRVLPSTPDARAGGYAQVALQLETNLVLAEEAQYLKETWLLIRSAAVLTRPAKGIRTFGCPSCGAPFESRENRCASCGKTVDSGRFDWTVHRVMVLDVQTVPPVLKGTVQEKGTDRPTVFQVGARERLEALQRDDAALTLEALSGRLALIFAELNAGWAAQDLKRVRPFVSDAMHDYLRYWVEAYRAQGLVNEVKGARIQRFVVARLERDRHYDAVTVRLWGTGFDVTTEAASGRVVGGDPRRERAYSEYWTLIRGASVRGAPRADKVCPRCGGPLAVSMAGNCEYCGALVTSGDFDWVLSRIEQDDVYAG